MSDKAFNSARRAMEISREIRRQVDEANAEIDRCNNESVNRLNQLEQDHGCRITHLEHRVDEIDDRESVTTIDLTIPGNPGWTGGAGLHGGQRGDA